MAISSDQASHTQSLQDAKKAQSDQYAYFASAENFALVMSVRQDLELHLPEVTRTELHKHTGIF